MLGKQGTDNFQKILQNNNVLLEAGIVQQVLQLKLTIIESVGMTNVYIGQIVSMDEHEKLKASCDSIQQVLELIKSKDVVKLNLEDLIVTLKANFGQKVIQVARIQLNKKEQQIPQISKFEMIINSCNSKNQLQDEKIKQNFEFLVDEMLCFYWHEISIWGLFKGMEWMWERLWK